MHQNSNIHVTAPSTFNAALLRVGLALLAVAAGPA